MTARLINDTDLYASKCDVCDKPGDLYAGSTISVFALTDEWGTLRYRFFYCSEECRCAVLLDSDSIVERLKGQCLIE